MSQKERVLQRLKQGPCSNMEFIYGMHIPRFGGRIFEINQAHLRAFGCKLIDKRPGPKPNIEIWYLADSVASEKAKPEAPEYRVEGEQLEWKFY